LLSRWEARRAHVVSIQSINTICGILTPRERDILIRVSQGLPNKLIARGLEISPETVKSHIKSIFLKLAVSTRAEAVSRSKSLGSAWARSHREAMTDTTEASDFQIDIANLCVWRWNGSAVAERLDLPPKTFDVLRYLAENAGRLVSHDELLTALWRDVHVQPEVVKSHILAIRNALGDNSSSPRFIETQRGRGYRFIGPINGFAATRESAEAVAEPSLLVGRAERLQMLQTLLQRAAAGERQAIFVSGEPGIGKTALVQAVIAQPRLIAGLVVAQGHCIEGFAGIEPYYPILEALGELCSGPSRTATVRAIMKLAPAWAAQMAELRTEQRESPPLPIDVARSRMVREGANLLEALAAEQPLLLVLEDLHWADFATVDLLSALCRRRSASKLMLIVTYRNEELGSARHPLQQMAHDLAVRKYCHEIELGPLPELAIAEILAGGLDGVPAPGGFTQLIKERSGGNPLFIELILEFLQQHGMAERVDRRWQLLAPIGKPATVTPPTLRRILEAQLDRMPDTARRVLEAASVAGLRFDTAMAAPAAEMDEQSFEAICEELSRNSSTIRQGDLAILPDGDLVRAYAFKHAVFRQVLYDRIGPARRAYLHRAIGDRLEEIYPPDKRGELAIPLAQHFAAARDWPRALDYLRSALRVANSRFARRDALLILDHAAELAANVPDGVRTAAELEFLERRGAIQAATHDPKARDTYAQLAEKAGQYGHLDVQCRALLSLSYVISWNDLGSSRLALEQALALSEKQSDPIQRDGTRVLAYVRRLWGFGWNWDDARRCEEALARLRTCGDSLSVARAELNFSMVCLVSTRYQEALNLMESAYQLLCETPQTEVEADLARAFWVRHVGVPWARFSLGEFGAAWKEFDASIASFEKSDDPSAVRSFQVYRGVLRFYMMDFEGVLQDCVPAAHGPSEDNSAPPVPVLPVERRIALIFGGLAKAGLENHSAALDSFRAAEAEMERQPAQLDWYWRLPLEWGMVSLLIFNGDRSTTLARAKHLCDLAAQTSERTWQALAWEAHARAALAFGDVAEAIDHVGKALAACAGVQVPLAELRVQATSATAYKAAGDAARARRHTRLGETIRKRLAESLSEGHPLRQRFEHRSGLLLAV
jgi:DNA-binding winged helix-turn-helix (wHTH) protein/DNA-binding CsgD family transcriptional regulator/tetratricopeptide (TPR) repeat protein